MSKLDFSKLSVETLLQLRADIDDCIKRRRDAEIRARALASAKEIADLKARYIETANAGWCNNISNIG